MEEKEKLVRVNERLAYDENGMLIGLYDPRREGVYDKEKEYKRSYLQLEAYKRKLEREARNAKRRKQRFVVCYHRTIKKLIKEVPIECLGVLANLLPYVKYNDEGRLYYEGEPINNKIIAKLIGKSVDRTKKLTAQLVKAGVLLTEKKGRSRVYKLSPEYHVMGEINKNLSFTKFYREAAKSKLKMLTIQQAGLLYAMIPYFHYSTFKLAFNPDEPDPDKVVAMTHKELAEEFNISTDSLTRWMKALMDLSIVLKISDGRVVHYKIHPDIMYRQEEDTDYAEMVRKDFRDFEESRKRLGIE